MPSNEIIEGEVVSSTEVSEVVRQRLPYRKLAYDARENAIQKIKDHDNGGRSKIVYPESVSKLREPIWEIQPNESWELYAYLKEFMDLPIYKRVVGEAVRIVREKRGSRARKENPSGLGSWKRYALAWYWDERATAHDRFLEQEIRARWLQREDERRERMWKIGGEVLDIVEDAIVLLKQENMDMAATPKNLAVLIAAGKALVGDAMPNIRLDNPEEISHLLDVLPAERASRIRMLLLMDKTTT